MVTEPLMTDNTQLLTDMYVYIEMIAGGMVEMLWIAKTFLVFYIIFSAWRLVRK